MCEGLTTPEKRRTELIRLVENDEIPCSRYMTGPDDDWLETIDHMTDEEIANELFGFLGL